MSSFFSLNATATTETYTLSLHDALPILDSDTARPRNCGTAQPHDSSSYLSFNDATTVGSASVVTSPMARPRSEEHTSELQSLRHLVCRLLLEKKKQQDNQRAYTSDKQA